MSYLKEKENLRYLFLAFIPYFHNEKKNECDLYRRHGHHSKVAY